VKIIWTPLALERVNDIARYIARDKPSAATKWVKELFRLVGRLSAQPQSCRIVSDLNRPDIRELIHGSYRVIYKLTGEIHILTVRHGRQMLDETTELDKPES
jgi:plasmid stabilization system protein ParE